MFIIKIQFCEEKKSANKIAEKKKCCKISLKDFRMSPNGGYLLKQINKKEYYLGIKKEMCMFNFLVQNSSFWPI